MPTQKTPPKLLYTGRTPRGWLRAAAAAVEQKSKAPGGWHEARQPPAPATASAYEAEQRLPGTH